MANSPTRENQRLTLSTDVLPNSGRTKTLISSPIISDSEDTSSDVGCSGRFAVWRLRCDARIAKERLRRQIRRSKTHVEGHVCYPWLRRLFFHLSHYFPNLHTASNPAQRMNTRGGINVKRTGTGGVQQSTGKTQKLNTNGRRAEQIVSAGQPSIIVVQTNPLSESHSPYNSSPQTPFLLSGNESRRKSLSPNSHRPQEKRVTSNPKRRPLQRQKISDTPDFDQFFTRSEFASSENKLSTAIPSTYDASSTRDLDQDSFVALRTFEYKPESTSHRNPRDPLINSPTQESMGQEEQTFPITRAKSRSKTSSSRQPPVSPRISGRRGPGIAALQLQNSDSQASSSLDPSNVWSEMPDSYDNEVTSPINSQAGPPLLNSQSRVHMSSTTRSVGPRAQPLENRSLIQYRRVKARRNSSNSQADNVPVVSQILSRSSKDESSNRIPEQEDPRSPNFLPLDTESVEEHGTVKKHVETWLEATANLTRQKQSRRRGNIYHICSGEANFEPPPAHMFQPRSFDSPIPMGMFESQKACSLIASPRRAIHRQLQCCSQQSSDSPQLILPSFTVDSTDDVLPYGMGESLEQQDSRPKGGAGNISYSPNAEEINYHGTYRRYSDNPTGHTRHTPQASISIESATGIIRTEPQTRPRGSPLGHEKSRTQGLSIALTSATVAAAPGNEHFLQTPSYGRERASSFHETEPSQRRKTPLASEFGANQSQLRYAAEKANLMRMAIIKQSRSFSGSRQECQSPTVQSFREDSDVNQHPPGFVHTPSKLLPCNPPNVSQQISRQQTGALMVGSCPYCPNCRPHCVRSRELQLSPGIPSQVYSEAGENFLKNPIALTFFERRYSHHLKPLDAWNSRQSHSMELVNTSHQSGRGSMCVGKQPLTSKLSLQRQVPQMYSRSMQQSTCSFPVHWCGFLSGPELSLTSPFDSASITPDSQKVRHFFEQSFDGVERDMTLTSHTLDHSAHVHSASGSPGYPHVRNLRLDRYMRGSQDSREQYLRSNLLCFQQTKERSRDRRVNSFELNLSGDRDRTTEPKRQSYLMLPNHYSSDSSRRGSALSNASIRSAREFAPRIDECLDDGPISAEPIVTSTPAFTGKLIPPDLTFSPASRRASIMEDQERNSPDAPLPLIFDNKLRLLNQEEVTEMDGQLRYDDSEAVESKVTGTTHPVGWKNETAAQSPKRERGVQSPLYREFGFESNSRSPGKHHNFQGGYLTEEQNPGMSAVRLMREQKSQDYQSMARLSAGPFCTPLSHSHDDLRRSRSQFAATTATTYPTLGSRPRFQDSHAYHVLARSLAPLVRGSTSQVSPHGGSAMLSSPRVRRVLGGSENRSTMSSCDQQGDILVPKENNKRSPNGRGLNATRSESGGTTKSTTPGTKRSVRGVRSDPFGMTEEAPKVHLNLDKCVKENYLFRSTSTGESNLDPRILEPSLCPVLDSSEENVTDETCDEEALGMSDRTKVQPRYTGRQSPMDYSDTNLASQRSRLPASEPHAARRRSFLARYWHQAIQRSGEDSLDGVDTLRTEADG